MWFFYKDTKVHVNRNKIDKAQKLIVFFNKNVREIQGQQKLSTKRVDSFLTPSKLIAPVTSENKS